VLSAGDRFADKFSIERMLGEGGMGVVYLARHEVLGERFAIKVLNDETAANQEAVKRFVNEARAAVRIKNEHIAAVMDVGLLPQGSAFMVMEYLEGQDLSDYLKAKGPLPVEEAVDYVLQALEGLAHAHAEGIVHRDLKPSNLFLTRARDGSPLVKVLDFGISKLADEKTPSELTRTTAMLGSPGYMSRSRCAARATSTRGPISGQWA
jgi:serine/threonine-protein kinase